METAYLKKTGRILGLALSLTLLSLAGPACFLAMKGNEACYKANSCDTAIADCYAGMTLIGGMLGSNSNGQPADASPSPSDSINTVVFIPETDPDATANDTFLTAQALPMPDSTTDIGVYGNIDAAGDVDIFYFAYTSGTSRIKNIDLSKATVSGICEVFGSFGPSQLSSAVNDGSLQYLGALYAYNTLPVTLDFDNNLTHVYIKCTGNANDAYSVKISHPAINPEPAASTENPIQGFMDLMCLSAEESCKAECDK